MQTQFLFCTPVGQLLAITVLVLLASDSRADVAIPNAGFELPVLGNTFSYGTSGGSWTFNQSAGISGNGSGFTAANPNAPQGVQVAFIQGTGRISQRLSGFSAGVTNTLRFQAAQRNYGQPGQTWRVLLDNTALASFSPPQSATSYAEYTVTFTTTTGAHDLVFLGSNLNGGDNTVFIDNVRLTAPLPAPRAAIRQQSTQVIVQCETVPGQTYRVEYKTNLATAVWEQLHDQDFPAGSATNLAVNDSADQEQRFYRIAAGVKLPEDYDGHPFVTNPAPVLSFQRKLAPTPTGIDYNFAEQTAHGVALLTRFPPFTLSDRRIHVDGPWYDSDAANVHFTRGIATVGAIPRYRENDNHPTTLRKAPQNRKWALLTDPVWYGHAANLANQLEAQNPADARIPALRALGVQHVLTNHEAAYLELGRYLFQRERWSMDINGHFVSYPAIDIEVISGGWEHQRNAIGWLYQGMAQAAGEAGRSIVPMLYGQWQFSVGTVHESMRQGGTGDPEYLLPEKDFLGSPDPTLVACQQNNGILSMDGYQQAMWGREPFYKRNTNGSLILAGSLPVYNDLTNTTAYGWNLYLEPGEARHCLENLYRAATRMYLQHHRRAGQYPATSALRKTYLTNCRIGAWSRYSNEGVQGIQQNDRPLPSWLLDMLIGMYLFTADDITLWSSDMNFTPAALGGNYTAAWRFNAHGVLESVVKAAHRYSALDPLHAVGGTFQWCWFNLPMINKNETAGDRYFEKPIAMGKLRSFEGHTYLELFVAWPALDNTAKTMKVWIDKDGQRSSAYTIQLAHGRTYFYDAWQLPDTFTNLEGKHIWLRTTDLLGTQRTWRGDWRQPVNNSIATPPDFQ